MVRIGADPHRWQKSARKRFHEVDPMIAMVAADFPRVDEGVHLPVCELGRVNEDTIPGEWRGGPCGGVS